MKINYAYCCAQNIFKNFLENNKFGTDFSY